MAWQTPKTDWQSADIVTKDDFNRIEGNIQELENTKETSAGAQAKVDTHAALTSAHGATSAATANRIIMRDSAGRAKVAAPSANDDIARKAEVDAVQLKLSVINKIYTVSGTANAITITTDGSFELQSGRWVKFKAIYNNAGSVTLNVDGKGVMPLKNPDGTDLTKDAIEAGSVYEVYYDAGNSFFVLAPKRGTAVITFENYEQPATDFEYDPDGPFRIIEVPHLSVQRRYPSSANVGNYALFAGGYSDLLSNVTGVVDAYNTLLERTNPSRLSTPRGYHGAGSIGDYALFAGGLNVSNATINSVETYNTSLTRSSATALATARQYISSAKVGSYLLFAGGLTNNESSGYETVDVYNTSLTRTTATNLYTPRGQMAGASVGNYALFAGGNQGSKTTQAWVDAYNTSLTKTMAADLSTARYLLAGASVGNYALFAGGGWWNGFYDMVDVYDSSLTRLTATPLDTASILYFGISLDTHAIFVGGSSNVNTVNTYSSSLVREVINKDTAYKSGACIDNYALAVGGYPGYSNDAVAFRTENSMFRIPVPIGTKHKFNTDTAEKVAENTYILVKSPATGYIKYKKGVVN